MADKERKEFAFIQEKIKERCDYSGLCGSVRAGGMFCIYTDAAGYGELAVSKRGPDDFNSGG